MVARENFHCPALYFFHFPFAYSLGQKYRLFQNGDALKENIEKIMEIFIIENNDKKKSEYATQCRKPGKK